MPRILWRRAFPRASQGVSVHEDLWRRAPARVSQGPQCHGTVGAEHIRASHMVPERRETLGAERSRVLHRSQAVSSRGGLKRSQRARSWNAECMQYRWSPNDDAGKERGRDLSAGSTPNHSLSGWQSGKSPVDVVLGRRKSDSTTRTPMKTPQK